MTLNCSVELWLYLAKRRAHMPTEQAAAEAGIGIGEARLHDQAEAQGEYAHIDTTTELPARDVRQPTEPAAVMADQRGESRVNGCLGGTGSHHPMVSNGSPQPKEEDMGRPRKKAADQVEEIKKPDFELVKRLYFNDIKPVKSKQASEMKEQSEAFKEIKKTAHVDPAVAKFVFALVETEQSKCEHKLRSLNGLLQIFRLYMPRDMVDVAEGRPENDNVIPIGGDAPRPQLATIQSDDPAPEDWRAGLKEGDGVMVPVGEAGSTAYVSARITFIEGDVIDVEYTDGDETVKASVPRGAVQQVQDGDDAMMQAAE